MAHTCPDCGNDCTCQADLSGVIDEDNNRYYATPLWMAALKWVKIAQSISKVRREMYENSLQIFYPENQDKS